MWQYNRTALQNTDTNHETQMHISGSLLKFSGHNYLRIWNKNCSTFFMIAHETDFLSTCAPFVTCQPFSIIFKAYGLCFRAANSIHNCPTKLNTHFQIRISFCSLSHIPFVTPLPVPANILCLTVRTRFVRTFDSYCHVYKTASTLTLILLTWRIWWASNNAANGRWDLTRRLKG